MKGRFWAFVIGAVMIASFASKAQAQWAEDRPTRYSFSISTYAPTCSKLADDAGSVWMTLAGAYVLTYDADEKPSTSVEFSIAKSSQGYFKGSQCSAVYMKSWHGNSPKTDKVYYGLGAGLFSDTVREESYWSTPYTSVAGFNDSGVRPGVCANIGVNLNEIWFAELRYTEVPSIGEGFGFSGISLGGGARFSF